MKRMLRFRAFLSLLSSGALLQLGACNLSAIDQDQLALDFQNIGDVVLGNLAANTVGFFINNAWFTLLN